MARAPSPEWSKASQLSSKEAIATLLSDTAEEAERHWQRALSYAKAARRIDARDHAINRAAMTRCT